MMIHDTNNKDSTKIKMKLEKGGLSALNIDSSKMGEELTFDKNGPYISERMEENTNTKNKGVWYNARTRCWLTCVKGTGRHLRVFSVKKYGYKQAKMLALECKSSMCTNDEEFPKKGELKEETEIYNEDYYTNGKFDGTLNANIHGNGVISDKWEFVTSKNENFNNENMSDYWNNGKYTNIYFNSTSRNSSSNINTFSNISAKDHIHNTNDSSSNNGSNESNGNGSIGNGSNGNGSNGNGSNGTGSNGNGSNGNGSNGNGNNGNGSNGNGSNGNCSNGNCSNGNCSSGNGNHQGDKNSYTTNSGKNSEIYGNSSNGSSYCAAKRTNKRRNKNGNQNNYILETKKSNETNSDISQSVNITNDIKTDSENKEIYEQTEKYNEQELTNRRYNTRRGNHVPTNEVKGARKGNTGTNNSNGGKTAESNTRCVAQNKNPADNIADEFNVLNNLKKRKQSGSKIRKQGLSNENEESDCDNTKTSKDEKLITKEKNMESCLITVDDFQLDSPESTDNENTFFNPFSCDISKRVSEKKRKTNKTEEKELSYTFTSGYYSDNRCKSKKVKKMYQKGKWHSHSNIFLNSFEGKRKGVLDMCNENGNGCTSTQNHQADDNTNNNNDRYSHMNDVKNTDNNQASNAQTNNNNRIYTNDEYNMKKVNKEGNGKMPSNYKTNFLDLTREALILILKDLKKNVIPTIPNDNEKKERYINVIRLCLRNTKYTKHFNELEPYLELFSECIKNSKLPSNMGVQEQLFYLDKL